MENIVAGNLWLTGASSGIGAALVTRLVKRGYRLALSSRNEIGLHALRDELATSVAKNIDIFPVDITDHAEVRDTVAKIESIVGDIDTCIFNAGDYEPMQASEFDAGLFRKLIDVNYMGVVNCLDAILPNMLGRKNGEILINASLAGYRGLPQGAPYGASKAALINMAESLRPELRQNGVDLRIINHGFVDTRLTRKNRFAMPFLITDEEAADRIAENLGKSGFEIIFPKRFAYVLKVVRCLPYVLFFQLMKRL